MCPGRGQGASKRKSQVSNQYFPRVKSIIIEPHCLSLSEGYHHVRENQTLTHLAQIQSLKDQKAATEVCSLRMESSVHDSDQSPHPHPHSVTTGALCVSREEPEEMGERDLDLGTATDGPTPRRRERASPDPQSKTQSNRAEPRARYCPAATRNQGSGSAQGGVAGAWGAAHPLRRRGTH